jgi:hypothetical protein
MPQIPHRSPQRGIWNKKADDYRAIAHMKKDSLNPIDIMVRATLLRLAENCEKTASDELNRVIVKPGDPVMSRPVDEPPPPPPPPGPPRTPKLPPIPLADWDGK